MPAKTSTASSASSGPSLVIVPLIVPSWPALSELSTSSRVKSCSSSGVTPKETGGDWTCSLSSF